MDRLRGKIAIVTGGANGIGKAISELFADEGAWVLIADREEGPGRETAANILVKGGAAEFCHCDVSQQADVKRAVAQAAARNGKIEFLCNNDGYVARDVAEQPEATDHAGR